MVQGKQRLSFQLIDPASKETLVSHLWEGKPESDLSSALGKEVAQAIYEILSAHDWSALMQAKWDAGLRNGDAREAITAARSLSHFSITDFDKAIGLLERAVSAEPKSALAHAYLAMEYTGRTHFSPDASLLDRAKKEAEIALQISPKSVEGHQALASLYYQAGRFSEALEQALQTLELGGPRDTLALLMGMTLDMLGRPHQALRWYELGARLTQNPGEADESIGDCWTKLARDEEAERAYRRAIELQSDPSDGIAGMARIRLLQGDFEAAREICRNLPLARGETGAIAAQIEFFARRFDKALELYRELHRVNPNGGGSFYGAMTYCSAAGRAMQALGNMSEAKRALEDCLIKERANAEREPENPEAVYRLAAAEASLGMREAALSHLRSSVALGWVDYRSLNLDPRFDSIRGPELQTILDELFARVAEMRNLAVRR
jgi:tetratricopeptide (TPR) repeat protein